MITLAMSLIAIVIAVVCCADRIGPTGSPVLTGELMTPLLSPRHPWQIHFGETPLPPVLPRTFDVIRVSVGLGMAAIDRMADAGHAVGPWLCCLAHHMLFIPVESGTADIWAAAHSTSSRGSTFQCLTQRQQPRCLHRFWAAGRDPIAAPTTHPAALHEALSLMRACLRQTRQPLDADKGEGRHV